MLLRLLSSRWFHSSSNSHEKYSLIEGKQNRIIFYVNAVNTLWKSSLVVANFSTAIFSRISHILFWVLLRSGHTNPRIPLSVKAARLLLLGNSMSKLKAASLWKWNVQSLFAVGHRQATEWLLNGGRAWIHVEHTPHRFMKVCCVSRKWDSQKISWGQAGKGYKTFWFGLHQSTVR